jgi:hypothetical protein
VLGLLLAPGIAEAQVPRGEATRGVTVAERARDDFDPLGVRLDGFRIDAAAELGLGYDDNLFGTKNNTTSDGYYSYGGAASAQTDWSTHALGLTGRVERRQFFENGDQDWTDYAVGAFGRYDVTPDTNVELRLNRVQEHYDTSSFDVQQAGVQRPVPYAYNEVQAQGRTRFNRLGILALGNWRGYRFENLDLGPATTPGGSAPGEFSINDYNSAIGALGFAYEIGPGRYVNLIGRFQDITYQDNTQSGRDSKTWEVLGGFTYDFDGVWGLRIAAGYRNRDYDDPRLKSLSGPAFEGELTWQPTLLTTVSFGARRTIEESIRADAVSYTRTQGQLRVDHEYLRNVILGAELGVDRREYDQPSQEATDGFVILSARWLINRNLALVTSYQYVRRLDSSGGFEEYDRNLVQVRLRISL